MSHPLRAIVVGLNHYHVTGWVETLGLFPAQIEIVGRYDPDPSRADASRPEFVDPNLPQQFADWFGDIPFSSNLEALVSETGAELAIVTLPNRLAPNAVVTLARNGCHVIMDKPGARTASEAEAAVEAARANGVKLAVAFTRRYGSAWQRVAADIGSGRLGRVLSCEAIFVTSSVPVRGPRNPIFDRTNMGGGILHWLGIHDIDLVQWLAGQPIVQVQAMTGTTSSDAIDVEDTISLQFRMANGAVGTMHFAYALPRPGGAGYMALRGSNAAVVIDAGGATEWIGPGTVTNPLRSESTTGDVTRLPGYGTAGAAIVLDMLDAIANDRDPLATGENARDALSVVDAAYESARIGRPVSIANADQFEGARR